LIACRQTLAGRSAQDYPRLVAAILALGMLASHLAMTAYFSASVGANSPGEADRLHGRYLGSALIILPFFYFMFLDRCDRRSVKAVSLTGIGACAAFLFFIYPGFKIYPWDYPELFGFFVAPNHYSWSHDGHTSLGYYALVLCAAGFGASLVRPELFRRIATIQL